MKDFLEWARPGSVDAQLAAGIDPARLPQHIAVIMDGNGRWAKRRRLPRVAGHRAGVAANPLLPVRDHRRRGDDLRRQARADRVARPGGYSWAMGLSVKR